MKRYELNIYLTRGEVFRCEVMAHSVSDAEEAVKPLIGRMLGYRGYKIREAE